MPLMALIIQFYPKWAGAYGSDHDVMRLDTNSSYGREKDAKFAKNTKELKKLEEFRSKGKNIDRYVHLVDVPRNKSTKLLYPYLANMNMHMSEILADPLHRQMIGELLSRPGAAQYLPFLVDTIGRTHGREVIITDVDFEKFPSDNPSEDLEKFRNLDSERTLQFRNHQDRILNRLDGLNPNANPRGVFAHFGVVDESNFSLIEYLGQKAGVNVDFWREGIKGTVVKPCGRFFVRMLEGLKGRL